MFLPIGDAPNPRDYTPWVTYGLMAANVLVYLFISLPLSGAVNPDATGLSDYLVYLDQQIPMFRDGSMSEVLQQYSTEEVLIFIQESYGLQVTGWDLAIFEYGYRPNQGGFSDLFTSLFMHAGFMHLAGNMLFLWIYGDNVEHRLGRTGYLVTYLLTGAIATISFASLDTSSGTPLVGASGAISGVLGVYFLCFKDNTVKVFVWFWFFIRTFMVPARIVLGIYVVWDNVIPLMTATDSNVAYGAHLGGFLGGLFIAYIGELVEWNSPGAERRERKRQGPQVLDFNTGRAILIGTDDDRAPEPDLTRAIEAAIAQNNPDRAMYHFIRSKPQDHELLSTESTAILGEWLSQRGFANSAGKLIKRRIRKVSGRSRSRLLLSLARVRIAQNQPTSAHQSLLDALRQDPDYKLELEIRNELNQIVH